MGEQHVLPYPPLRQTERHLTAEVQRKKDRIGSVLVTQGKQKPNTHELKTLMRSLLYSTSAICTSEQVYRILYKTKPNLQNYTKRRLIP